MVGFSHAKCTKICSGHVFTVRHISYFVGEQIFTSIFLNVLCSPAPWSPCNTYSVQQRLLYSTLQNSKHSYHITRKSLMLLSNRTTVKRRRWGISFFRTIVVVVASHSAPQVVIFVIVVLFFVVVIIIINTIVFFTF